MNTVITDYEFLSSVMGKMRVAATQGEWEELIKLESQCSQRVAEMKVRDAATPLDEATRLRKVALIRKILSDDAEIRNQTEPKLAELQRLLQGITQERRVFNAYTS